MKISKNTVLLLHERNLLKSSDISKKKQSSQSTTYFKFLDIVRSELADQIYILKINDYPYNVYCGDDLEHFVLWFWSKISKSDLQKIINSIPNLHSYWQNPREYQSLSDTKINHIQIFVSKIN